ncbi:MAG: ABC transporter permease, partial [Lachnospiraceae bacterium]|nr:ABC transporter permease [Lachnospiraceae bacterium]
MFENIGLAFQGVWSHKLRSFLTMLGIIIGIAAIITIVSTIKGTNEQIKKNLIGSGTNTVQVSLSRDGNNYDMQWGALPDGVRVIREEDLAELRKLEGVMDVTAYRARSYADGIYYQNTNYSGSLYGIDSHYFNTNNYRITNGRG